MSYLLKRSWHNNVIYRWEICHFVCATNDWESPIGGFLSDVKLVAQDESPRCQILNFFFTNHIDHVMPSRPFCLFWRVAFCLITNKTCWAACLNEGSVKCLHVIVRPIKRTMLIHVEKVNENYFARTYDSCTYFPRGSKDRYCVTTPICLFFFPTPHLLIPSLHHLIRPNADKYNQRGSSSHRSAKNAVLKSDFCWHARGRLRSRSKKASAKPVRACLFVNGWQQMNIIIVHAKDVQAMLSLTQFHSQLIKKWCLMWHDAANRALIPPGQTVTHCVSGVKPITLKPRQSLWLHRQCCSALRMQRRRCHPTRTRR